MLNNLTTSEHGTSLVEVLVALVLLSIAVLGFTAFQLNAFKATNEAGTRIQASVVAQDLAERMRAVASQSAANGVVGNNVIQDVLNAYMTAINAANLSTTTCGTTARDAQLKSLTNQINCDAFDIRTRATTLGMTVRLNACAGIAFERRCIYVAWNKTSPTESTTDNLSCTNNGTYRPAADCIVLETY